MNINFRTIPHKEQRYDTAGDWWYDEHGTLQVRVSQMSDWRYEALVLVHELVEVFICKQDGITQQQVDEFDMEFENRRSKSITNDFSEPGDHRFAPYQKQHCFATGVERILAACLGCKWSDYETEINSLK